MALDFLKIIVENPKDGVFVVEPDFKVRKSKDLMIKGGDFYAVWDYRNNKWTTDEDVALEYIDEAVWEEVSKVKKKYGDDVTIKVKTTASHKSGVSAKWHNYCQSQMRDNFVPLDKKLIFANEEITKSDYATRKLDYALEDGDISAYEDLINVLYSPSERRKLEWGIGSVISGDSVKNEKFFVLYGAPGSGKGTFIKILQKLFQGYCKSFESKLLGSSRSAFPLEQFKDNPLVAYDPDGNLSRIDDNSRLNALVSHEEMPINVKNANIYTASFSSLLYICTNTVVKITDAKSGLVRRMIEVTPTGVIVDSERWNRDMARIDFELGAIAKHCLDVYLSNKEMYRQYVPKTMIGGSNPMYNFIEHSYDDFSSAEGVTLKRAWSSYKEFCENANFKFTMDMLQFREELKNYFYDYDEVYVAADGAKYKQFYSKFHFDLTRIVEKSSNAPIPSWLILSDSNVSTIDTEFSEYTAQYAETYRDSSGRLRVDAPTVAWNDCKTKLKDLDTHKVHFVKPPDDLKLIFYDFDIRGKDGVKSFELCQKKCMELGLRPSYAELSKGGGGLHVYYYYKGGHDLEELSSYICENVELKICKGGNTLRRRLIKCNDLPIADISSGLPFKVKKGGNMVNQQSVKSEAKLKELIDRSLKKEFEPHHTSPAIDFIDHLLNEAYDSGLKYDLTSMRNRVSAFAAGSTNNAVGCLKKVNQMKFKSKDFETTIVRFVLDPEACEVASGPIAFFDVEIFDSDPNDPDNPGLFLVCYKVIDEDKVTALINPSPQVIDDLFITNTNQYKWTGFNNRRYDNHMVYGRYLGKSPHELYLLSQRIIVHKDKDAAFGQARNVSYTDVLDFVSKKQSLKKYEIELDVPHKEFAWEWDKPLPKKLWEKAAEYCKNDVRATEAVFKARHADFVCREIIADLAGYGSTVNDTTNTLATRIIVGNKKNPVLNCPDLSLEFPDYKPVVNEDGRVLKNMYRGIDLGFGGYAFSTTGYFTNVALLDVQSMHPHTIKAINYFGDDTQNYVDILNARLYIKHEDYESAKKLFDGKLAKYLDNKDDAANLSQALKIVLNSTYGLTYTAYSNPLKSPDNKNNIIALRGALFMKTLQDEVESRGYTVVHIKTDSIKIANADQAIIDFCMDFAKKYGYDFDHEATYEKMCIVNKAVYIAKEALDSPDYKKKVSKYLKKHPDGKAEDVTRWTATGEQFKIPFIFKNLFSHEPVVFDDYCEVFEVKEGALYLDYNEEYEDKSNELQARIKYLEGLIRKFSIKNIHPDLESLDDPIAVKTYVEMINGSTSIADRAAKRYPDYDRSISSQENLDKWIAEEEKLHHYEFVGRIGQFTPIRDRFGAARLRVKRQGVYSYASGSKGYRWLESSEVKGTDLENAVDDRYFISLLDEAKDAISKYVPFDEFVSETDFLNIPEEEDEELPFV